VAIAVSGLGDLNSGPRSKIFPVASLLNRETKKKITGRPKRLRGVKSNMVAAAVELAGGVTAVSKLCGVARQSVYTWIEEWRVERLIDALKLARASGIPIERLAGEAFKPERIPAAKSPAPSHEHDEDHE
jgi:transposase-like protein